MPPLTPMSNFQQGTIARLNVDCGFGYVRDCAGEHSYIFLLGRAVTWAEARGLRVGSRVRFRVEGHGRVNELIAVNQGEPA